jgi:hypothetical protein
MSFPSKNKKGLTWPPDPDHAQASVLERKKPRKSLGVVVKAGDSSHPEPVVTKKKKTSAAVPKKLVSEKKAVKGAKVWDPDKQAYVELSGLETVDPECGCESDELSPGEKVAIRAVFSADKKKRKNHKRKRSAVSREKEPEIRPKKRSKTYKKTEFAASDRSLTASGVIRANFGWLLAIFSWAFFLTFLLLGVIH